MSSKTRKCRACPELVYADNISGLCRNCYNRQRHAQTAPAMVTADRERARKDEELLLLKKKYAGALETIERQERELHALNIIGTGVETFDIPEYTRGGGTEATAFWVASDWHVEENVDPRVVSGLNKYNLDTAKARATQFFQHGLRLTNLLAQDVKLPTIVLALLGDFISNDIHEEVAEVSEIAPAHAVTFARDLIASGIEHVLEHSDYNLVIPCHSGNHGRTTKTTRFATENGHSLEYLMYLLLAAHFRSEPRVKFIVSEGYHSYLTCYGRTVRFHHGHAVKYGGGVGGLFIPAYKAIAQWNKARRADLDVFGHFHQSKDGGNFLCNGSMIGYNAFALSIKADYEPPQQTLFLMDNKRGRTCTWPIRFKE